MRERLINALFGADEVETPIGRAIVTERYATLRRQIPVIYLLALVNLAGLELATGGTLSVGLNLPTAIGLCGAVRIVQWRSSKKQLRPEQMLSRLRQTCALAVLLCFAVCVRAIHVLQVTDPQAHMAVMLFGGFTAIGVAYGLSCHPIASRLPLIVLALPLAGLAPVAANWQLFGASISLVVVTLLVLRLLSVHNAQFTDIIRSRAMIEHQQEIAERARQEAVVAATTDFLTGLPNRRAFVAALEARLVAGKDDASFAVAILDLDGFKSTNDTFGHATGDALLQTVANRLLESAGPAAIVARLGGDEFGVLLPHLRSASEARAAGKRMIESISDPVIIHSRQFTACACCGLGIFPQGKARTPSRVLAEADLALYQAKGRRGGGVAIFEPHMESSQRRRAEIERALQLPGVHENIYLVYQPIIDLQTGRIVANEALARWKDEDLGEVSPAEFVPIAEQLNVIGGISHHLMIAAFAEAVHWPADVRLSFNLSAIQVCSADAAETILEALARAGLANARLQVEVTETTLLADFSSARENLARLRAAGVTIVLDDFGAGYASIAYLKELRFDQIKLDGGLVTAARDNSDGERLLAAVIGLCNALGVSSVAEHVENEEQLTLLQTLGCASGQGFWLQPPMPAQAARELARASSLIGPAGRHGTSTVSFACGSKSG